jgi:hypothetical protein
LSSEVDAGSRQENASEQPKSLRSDSIGTEALVLIRAYVKALVVGVRRDRLTGPFRTGIPTTPVSPTSPGLVIVFLAEGIAGVPGVANLADHGFSLLLFRYDRPGGQQGKYHGGAKNFNHLELRHGFFLFCSKQTNATGTRRRCNGVSGVPDNRLKGKHRMKQAIPDSDGAIFKWM